MVATNYNSDKTPNLAFSSIVMTDPITPVPGQRPANTNITVQQIRVGGSAGAQIFSGAGSPEGAITAPVGSKYFRTDSTGNTYTKTNGTSNTGWYDELLRTHG
jgi:hypothetical protein